MNALARAGWLLCAAFFAVLLSSIFHVDFVSPVAGVLLIALATIAAFFPAVAMSLVVLLVPVIGVVLAARQVTGTVSWPETLVCAAVTGLSLRAAARASRPAPWSLAAPALIFTCIVIASVVASLGVVALRLGPAFTDALIRHFTREHFVDTRGFPAITTGLRLLEGVLLFVLTARLALPSHHLKRVLAAAVAGGTLAAAMNIGRLVQVAARTDNIRASLIDLSQRLRWNVHYSDINAAGSYFLLALLFAAALVVSSRRIERLLWLVCAILVGGALWLTSSRVAFLAGVLSCATAMALPHLVGRALVRAATILVVGVALLLGLAIALPHREGQVSAIVAADVRFGMARTGARMIQSHPTFGVGVGEFTQRAAEFTEPALIEKMPAAAHENAHNYFIQMAAELGLTGGVAFVWLVGAALFVSMRPQTGADPGLERRRALTGAGLAAFVLTWLGGHPLLVPEPAFVFWTTLGAVAGASAKETVISPRAKWWMGAVCIILFATVPWRMQGMLRDANLEHVGIGVSSVFRIAPDGTRYRDAQGHATLFVPVGAFKFSVNPRTATPVRLELRLDHRIADVVTLAPNVWNDVSLPARTERLVSRYAQLDLRILDNDETTLWITKVQPIQ